MYYATDRMGSIVGVMDDAGALIERVSYDPYGRPTIEAADPFAPMVSSVQREANGDLLVAFTEAVLPPPSTTAGTSIVNSLASLSGAVTLLRDVSGTMTAVAGTWSYEEGATGFDHGTVLRFVPGESLAAGSAVALSVNAGGLIDSWSNAASAVTLNFNIGAGVLYTGPPQGSTSTPVVERSLVGNGLLFQAHLWDADAGLYLARARVLDPTTGTFLQRDPSGYADSVNLYAVLSGDPINKRDPTGTIPVRGSSDPFAECPGGCHTPDPAAWNYSAHPFEDYWEAIQAGRTHNFRGMRLNPAEQTGYTNWRAQELAEKGKTALAEVVQSDCPSLYCHIVKEAGHEPTNQELDLRRLGRSFESQAWETGNVLLMAVAALPGAGLSASEDSVVLYHGSKNFEGEAFDLPKAVARKRGFTGKPGIYLTDDFKRAAQQYAGQGGTVVRSRVSKEFAQSILKPGGPPAKLPEYFVDTPQGVEVLNKDVQVVLCRK